MRWRSEEMEGKSRGRKDEVEKRWRKNEVEGKRR